MDWRLYFPSEGRRAEDFFALKNLTASAEFEPANLGTKGQHATSRPPKPLYEATPLLLPVVFTACTRMTLLSHRNCEIWSVQGFSNVTADSAQLLLPLLLQTVKELWNHACYVRWHLWKFLWATQSSNDSPYKEKHIAGNIKMLIY